MWLVGRKSFFGCRRPRTRPGCTRAAVQHVCDAAGMEGSPQESGGNKTRNGAQTWKAFVGLTAQPVTVCSCCSVVSSCAVSQTNTRTAVQEHTKKYFASRENTTGRSVSEPPPPWLPRTAASIGRASAGKRCCAGAVLCLPVLPVLHAVLLRRRRRAAAQRQNFA
jgi:hypothetical protein